MPQNSSIGKARHHLPFAILMMATLLTWSGAAASQIASKRVECPTGQFVVGLAGRTGLWIDAIAPICARWDDRSLQSDAPRMGPFTGGPGGGASQQSCPVGSAIAEWRVREILQNSQGFAQSIQVECRSLAPPHYNVSIPPPSFRYGGSGTNLPSVLHEPDQQNCPSDELMTGMDVWSTLDERFVTHLSLRCGKAPVVQTDTTTQAGPNGAVSYSLPSVALPGGNRILLDACRDWATNCGEPAADAFCKSVGKAKATEFTLKPNARLTVVLSSKKVCNGATGCTGFAKIACSAQP